MRALVFGLVIALSLGPDAASAAAPLPQDSASVVAAVDDTGEPAVAPEPPSPSTSPPVPEPGATGAPEPTPTPTPTPTPAPTEPEADPAPDGEEPAPQPGAPDPSPPPDSSEAIAPLAVSEVPTMPRLAGADRFSTSVAASQAAFPSGTATVLVTSGYAPVDAIIAAGLAAGLSAPILYVHPETVPDVVAAEIARLGATSIVIVGGATVVPDPVADRLRAIVPDVRRFGGGDRFETSRLAMLGRSTPTDTAYLTGGAGQIDPPVASVAAAATDRAALLVNGLQASVDAPTADALRSLGVRNLVLVGGLGTIGSSYEASLRAEGFAVSRRTGADRYATAVMMADERSAPAARAIVANSGTAADVGVAAGLAAVTRQPLYYTIKPCLVDVAAAHIAAAGLAVTAVGGPVWLGAPVLEGRSCASVRADGERALEAALQATLSQIGGSYAVSVRELTGTNQTVHINGAQQREPASMLKVFAAWAALKRIEQGRAGFGTILPSGATLGGCIHVMIVASDNYCHSDIVHWITIPEINRMISAAGFPGTFYGNVSAGTSVLYGGNRTTSSDSSLFLRRLRSGEVLAPWLADVLLHPMRTQVFRTRIPSGIPAGVPQASKPGALWLSGGLMHADTAIIDGPESTYVLTVIGDVHTSQAGIRVISRTVYEHFHGAFGAAASYPVEQVLTVAPTVVRASPGGAVVAGLPQWYPLQVLDARRLWYLVQYGSRQVWIFYSDVVTR
ncbi:serine hydrolase [Microbacterium atlanticum]|uniref:serine hydrolase n=1 Tax=Microbacterium atlanticum TaxID=2782168 RepID=UPI001887E47D|nr:serine hydrolase [Microbacterium atlanticum]